MTAPVIAEIKPASYRDPVKMLRNLADDIEAGKFEEVTSIGVVTFGDVGLEIFGGGIDSAPPVIGMLFHAAANKVSNSLLEFI